MISLSCTNCKSVLEIDDAFAGGVCRCTHCGTIQTVPAHLKGNASGKVAVGSGAAGDKKSGRSLYVKSQRNEAAYPGLRLDPTARVAAGTNRVPSPGVANHPPPASNEGRSSGRWRMVVLGVAGMVAIVLIAAFMWLARG
jgi:hypothetical protein